MARVTLLALLVVAHPAHAQDCNPHEVWTLRAHLEEEAHRAAVWNWGWRITFTTAAVGSLAVAVANPYPDYQDGLYVSAGKAGIAALARWILPLTIDVPALTGDDCADVATLRAQVKRIAKKERRLFWLGHLGGVVLNAAGAIIIAERGSLGQGLLSVATGYPIGLLSTYTMPRDSWHLWRETTWTASVVARRDGWLVTLSLTL